MKRSFTSLEPPEALQVAIMIEERNAEVYRRFAQMFTELGDAESLEIAAVFWEMATEERGHHALLQRKYAEQYPDLIGAVTEDELLERIEVPKLNDHDVFAARNDGLLARKLALQVALQAEIGAQSYYANLVKQTPEGPLRQIYGDLAEMEEGHATYLSMKLGQDNAEDQSMP